MLVLAFSTLACQLTVGWPGGRTVTGSGTLVEETREVSGFTGVELALATLGNLHIEVGEEEALRIEAEDNLMRYIDTEVRGDTLHIESPKNVVLIPKSRVDLYLTVKELDTIGVSGAASVDTPDLEATRFAVTISGAGDVDVDGLEADSLEVDISGAGDVYIEEGAVEEQEIIVSGGGNYQARGLESAEADIRLSGVGSATVRVRDRLKVKISGAGQVRYVGNPTVEEDISGVGSIEQIGE
jgi:hypothetical protein